MRKPFIISPLLLVGLLTAAAQSDTFQVRIENVSDAYPFTSSGVFNTPVGAAEPAPIGPGGAYEFTFSAAPGAKLSLATMFVPSNDLFYAPDENGIALYGPDGTPVTGDVTNQVMLWDAGTEENQEPGVGPDQAQRQSGADTGPADPIATVRIASDGFAYPAASEVLLVTVNSEFAPEFTVRVENVSTSNTLQPTDSSMQPVPLAPGVWVVHTDPAPLFASGEADRGEGLGALAEDGNPVGLGAVLADNTGITVPLAPGVWAVHAEAAPLFTSSQPDRGDGLEALAEDGNPGALGSALANDSAVLSSGVFNTPVGAGNPAPIGPGGVYEFTISASPGARLSFATMFVHSNDLFYSPEEMGIALFPSGGSPVTGDVTDQVMLWDAGTEENQEPGVGPDQAPRQTGPDTGAPDPDSSLRLVDDGFAYPPTSDVIRVTISSSAATAVSSSTWGAVKQAFQ